MPANGILRRMITTLPERIAALPTAIRAACERVFFVQRVEGRASIPEPMTPWVIGRFGDLDQVRHQTIIRVVNRFTLEAALFNPIRALRPGGAALADADLDRWIAAETADGDMFATPHTATTADLFGRIQGKYCISASNVAKYDAWHGLVVFAEPHPLHFDREHVADYLDVALRWIAAAHQQDPLAVYPMITWNCLPRSGATIAHGHMQMSLARGMHYSRPECWRRAAVAYGDVEGYFNDLVAIHTALDLALPVGRVFVHLTPLRNHEIVLLAPSSAYQAGTLATDLAALIYPALRVLIDRHGMRSFNIGIALPPLVADTEWSAMPVITRIADRGLALNLRNDWGAMELFASGCITTDPWAVAATLR